MISYLFFIHCIGYQRQLYQKRVLLPFRCILQHYSFLSTPTQCYVHLYIVTFIFNSQRILQIEKRISWIKRTECSRTQEILKKCKQTTLLKCKKGNTLTGSSQAGNKYEMGRVFLRTTQRCCETKQRKCTKTKRIYCRRSLTVEANQFFDVVEGELRTFPNKNSKNS